MAGLMSALLASPELRQAFQTAARPPQAVVGAVVARAVERGEIPEPQDLETLGSVMPSMCMFHFVKTGTAPDRRFIETVVDTIVMPALCHQSSHQSSHHGSHQSSQSSHKKGR
jgi:hypothetical protein